jgi:hypothetical protein
VVGSATDWAIVDGIDHSQTIIHINTKPILVASDWHFA